MAMRIALLVTLCLLGVSCSKVPGHKDEPRFVDESSILCMAKEWPVDRKEVIAAASSWSSCMESQAGIDCGEWRTQYVGAVNCRDTVTGEVADDPYLNDHL